MTSTIYTIQFVNERAIAGKYCFFTAPPIPNNSANVYTNTWRSFSTPPNGTFKIPTTVDFNAVSKFFVSEVDYETSAIIDFSQSSVIPTSIDFSVGAGVGYTSAVVRHLPTGMFDVHPKVLPTVTVGTVKEV